MSKERTANQLIAQKIINSNWFNMAILVVIVINGIFIGVQTYDNIPGYVHYIQLFILLVFFLEVILRWFGRRSTQEYFGDRWNIFDIIILLVGVVPEVADIIIPHTDNESQNSVWATLRVLRIVQLTRSIRAIEDLRVLIGVLLKSIRSLSYIAVLFFLILYIYAIIGVTLFKNHDYENSEHLELTISNPDPYGDIFEASFTLFRILTGEDWTDLRYNLIQNEYTQSREKRLDAEGNVEEDFMTSVPGASSAAVTFYHVSWMVIAAYLLMNLVVGAIVNNFQVVLDARREEELEEEAVVNEKRKQRVFKRPKV